MMILPPRPAVIVISVLLVSASLLAINPLEQLRVSQDRELEAEGRRLLNALEHYYKVFFEYPWEVSGEAKPGEAAVKTSWLQELVSKEMMDPEFANRSSLKRIYITQNDGIWGCFDPSSRRFQTQADTQGRGRDGIPGCLHDCWICQDGEESL